MAQATLSMRVDDTLKKNFDSICDDFGFTSTAAITVFVKDAFRLRSRHQPKNRSTRTLGSLSSR